MSKVKPLIIKYTPYVLFIMGIFIYITFFIAGGVKTSEKIYHPDGSGGFYHFTIFQALFGKSLTIGGYRQVFFKFNLLGVFIILGLGIGIISSTINSFKYKTRNLVSAASLLLTSLLLFLVPQTTNLGSGWYLEESSIIVTMGAPLIIAVVITAVMGVIYSILAFFKEIN